MRTIKLIKMAAYGVLGRLSGKVDRKIIVAPFIRCAHWNKDWKPGPVPKTPEEHAAAAKKYGLIPEDYRPLQEESPGFGFGDYPQLENISAENRNPFEAYDSLVYKRNYGEPLNVNFDIYGEDRLNVNPRRRTSIKFKATCFLSFVFGGLGLLILGEFFKYERPFMPRQFPNNGEKHYTFEPLAEK